MIQKTTKTSRHENTKEEWTRRREGVKMRRMLCYSVFACSLLSLFVVSGAFAQNSVPTHISIEGTLLMLDDKTPHVAVVVQTIRGGKSVATVLSDEGGEYQFINLEPGTYQVRCYTLDGYLYYGEDKPTDGSHAASLQVKSGRTLKDVDLRFPPFKKGTWKSYTRFDGLAGDRIWVIYRDLDGNMWFGDRGSGVTRYGKEGFVTFTTKDGLVHDYISAIYQTPDGMMWFGSSPASLGDGGISRYDGKTFVNFTTADGLTDNHVQAICRDTDGNLWFATWGGGVSRYDGKTFTNFTEEDGLGSNHVNAIYQGSDGAIWFVTGQWWTDWYGGGVSRYDGGTFTNFSTKDGLAHNTVNAINSTPDGALWFGTRNGVSRYDGRMFTNFTTADGLVSNEVLTIYCDSDGALWFGTNTKGVSRYDGKTFVNFTRADGLANEFVSTIRQDPDGVLWFGTDGGVFRYDRETFINFTDTDGLKMRLVWTICEDSDENMWLGSGWVGHGASCYDGEKFVNFTTNDGLVDNRVRAIHQSPDGIIWFGTADGISRYDGEKFVNLTTADGLASNWVMAIQHDPDGMVWFGTGYGASRYDGKTFVNFAAQDGPADDPADDFVQTIYRDRSGSMWFGAYGGIFRYDGREFINFTTKDGLAEDYIWSIHQDPDGIMWFGLSSWEGIGKGLSRYNGKDFVNFSIEDGLAHNVVRDIHRDSDGILWVATYGGVSGYNGSAWTSLDTRDGLPSNQVWAIHQDSEGYLWFGASGGLTRYRRSSTPPRVHIASVTADETYDDPSVIPSFSTGQRITVKYKAIDLKTHPEKQQYRCRIEGIDSDWRVPIKDTFLDYSFRKPGTYTFQVQAIDRDLNYSEPASLKLEIITPFYLRAIFLIPVIGSGTILLAALVFLATALTKRRRQVHAYERMAVQELQDARKMQVSLLPETVPQVEGVEIAGRSITANTVGGDFFDYLALADGKVGIAMADVSGKGLRAAMNAVLADGMMHEVATIEAFCGRILSRLNAHLYPLMEKQMFTAFSFAILDQDADVIQWSNAAQPLPLIKRSNGASEAEEDGQLPLGMLPDVKYPDCELKLRAGDMVIFYTDGIIEAENQAEEMYGTERLLNLVTGIDSAASAEYVIEAILQDVAHFVGDAERYDDMTAVVVKKL